MIGETVLSYRAGHAGHGVSVKDPKSVIHLQRQGTELCGIDLRRCSLFSWGALAKR